MRLFLVSFFVLYSLMHLYAFLKTRKAIHMSSGTAIALALFMIIMISAPVLVHYAEELGHERTARGIAYSGYFWMGILFLFVSVNVLIDLYFLVLFILESVIHTNASALRPHQMLSYILSLSSAVLIGIYGYWDAHRIQTEHIVLQTDKIPAEHSGFRIVQISDIHLGLIVREKRLNKIIHAVREADPDVVVSTGDLVDGQINELEGLATILRTINPPYGKYAITGNHEFYAGLSQAMEFTKKAGFRILRGEAINVGNVITIAGVDDQAGRIYHLSADVPEKSLLEGISRNSFTLLLKHRPLIDNSAAGLFDLQLSGHTHKGQIFPFGLITRLYYPRDAGYMRLQSNSHLYVSRGSGTWGPPIRFLSPPEVTVIELVRPDL